MLIWTDDLKRLGFRRKSEHHWRCDRGYGLDSESHISAFLWEVHDQAGESAECHEFAEFHVTIEVPGHNLHFYCHEVSCNEWAPAGHTSTAELACLGLDVDDLRELSDEISEGLVAVIGGEWCERAATDKFVC